jgi:hypothetical protein
MFSYLSSTRRRTRVVECSGKVSWLTAKSRFEISASRLPIFSDSDLCEASAVYSCAGSNGVSPLSLEPMRLLFIL